jgi:non-specific serine/threonine protein kinase
VIGTLLDGKYRIDALVGRGGMGAVYRATQLALSRQVAVKILHADRSSERRVARFRREARLTAKLRHLNLVRVYDFGVAEGIGPYLVMELLGGRSLRDELRARETLPPHEAVALARAICAGLEAVHEAGLVHCDLKPANVILVETASGVTPKLLDFGIARTLAGGRAAAAGPNEIVGSPRYMSPEQCQGEALGRATDVYALGCVLYEMLTGRGPFVSVTIPGLLYHHVATTPAPPSARRSGISEGLDRVVLRTLEKDPGARFATAADLAEALALVDVAPSVAPPHNFPAARTPLVGRESDVERVTAMLARARLVTLVGAGGIGKTRLALHAAGEVLGQFADGAWLVDLAPVTDAEGVVRATAAALGVRGEPGETLANAVVGHARRRRMLLVLDNCEQVREAVAPFAAGLLDAAPGVRILATSRSVLAIGDDAVVPVPPLEVPVADPRPDAARLAECASVRLFVEQARRRVAGFCVDEGNAAAIAELARRLEGIPLAIELAAARVAVLAVEQIVSRLGDRFRLLGGGSRTDSERHRTLRATMEWSYRLLDERERRLLNRLSVFVGGWTVEAAERVGGEQEGVLASLVDKSLVVAEVGDGRARYGMLETIRDYARERLVEDGALDDAVDAHRRWALALAETHGPNVRGATAEVAFAALAPELDNVRAALARCGEGEADVRVRLSAAMGRYWVDCGSVDEGRSRLEEALAAERGRFPAARAELLGHFADCVFRQGETDRAIRLGEEAVALYRALGDAAGLRHALARMSIAYEYCGMHDAALGACEEVMRLATEQGDRRSLATATMQVAFLAISRGEFDRAEALYARALDDLRALNDQRAVAIVLHNLGDVAFRQARYEDAERLLGECAELAERVGNKPLLAVTLCLLGGVANATGAASRAESHLVRALAIGRETGNRMAVAYAVDGLACAAAARGEAERALVIAGAAAGLFDRAGVRLSDYEVELTNVLLAPARDALGPEGAAEAFARGGALSPEEAADLAGEP